jgi:peptidoglycan/LPS O-acetylase OafA/YrhL
MSRRTDELTGLRCVAVTLVIASHAERMTPDGYIGLLQPLRLLTAGGLGVLVFFVLSGFLITDLLQREWRQSGKIDLAAFYMRRVLRIWPAFYAYIIAASLLAVTGVLDIHYRQIFFAAAHLWNYSALLGLKATDAVHPDGTWYLGHFWTLALEEQFYWFWPPVLLYCLTRRTSRPLIFLIVLVPIIRMATYFGVPSMRGELLMMVHTGVDPILVGCFAGLYKERLRKMVGELPHNSLLLTALVLMLFLAMPLADRHLGGYWTATFGRTIEAAMAAAVIITLTVKHDFWFSRLLRTRVFVAVGTVSYSLYLWQQLFFNVDTPFAYRFPICIVEALAAATLSYWLIERPFLQLKDYLGATGKRRVVDAVAAPMAQQATAGHITDLQS